MAKKNYEELAVKIVKSVGGKENISYFAHCMTRLRFAIKDKSKVQEGSLQEIKGVAGINWVGEQLQVIVGQACEEVYGIICRNEGIGEVDRINENLDRKKKKFSISGILEVISGIVVPITPILIVVGLLKLVVVLCGYVGLDTTGPTFTVLNFTADAGLYFLPVYTAAYAAKRLGCSVPVAMLLGGTLIAPGFVSAVAEGTGLTIYGLPVYGGTYSSTLIPVILTVAVMAQVEKFIAKILPDVLKSLLLPLLVVLIMLPLELCVLAPIGFYLGEWMSGVFIWLYETTGFLGVAIIAALWPLLIMVGMHQALAPYCLNAFATLGYEAILIPCSIVHNFSVAGACLAVGIKSRKADTKSLGISCAASTFLGSISEPGVYGVLLRFKTPLYCAMAANFVAGAILGLNHVYAMYLGGGCLAGLPVFASDRPSTFVWGCIACAAATVLTFVLTFIFYKDPKEA